MLEPQAKRPFMAIFRVFRPQGAGFGYGPSAWSAVPYRDAPLADAVVSRPWRVILRAVRGAGSCPRCSWAVRRGIRSEEHTSELQSLMRLSYAVFCLKKKKDKTRYSNK